MNGVTVPQIRNAMDEADNRVIDRSESQLAERRPAPIEARVVESEPTSILAVISKGIDKNMSHEALQGLYALYAKDKAARAAEAFNEALATFQSEVTTIRKTGKAVLANAGFSYTYAELDVIAATVRPLLVKHKLSYTWDCTEKDGTLTCTCKVRHANGHESTATFACSTEGPNNKISKAQQSGGALTYARRQSLIMALGLSVGDPDTDGSRGPEAYEKVDANQIANLQHMLDEINANAASRVKFLDRFNVKAFADLPKARYLEAVKMIDERRKGAK